MDYGFHKEQMEFAGISRSDYLRALRCLQTTEELERKAKKAKRRGDVWTQEQADCRASRLAGLLWYFGHCR